MALLDCFGRELWRHDDQPFAQKTAPDSSTPEVSQPESQAASPICSPVVSPALPSSSSEMEWDGGDDDGEFASQLGSDDEMSTF